MAGAPQPAHQLVVQVGVGVADEREPGDLPEADRPRRDLGGSGRRDADERVGQHPAYREGPVEHRQRRERQVEPAGLDARRQLGVGAGLAGGQLDARPLLAEPAQQQRQHLGADALHQADVQGAALAGEQRGDVGLGGVQPGDDRPGVHHQRLPDRGQPDPPGPARPLQQRRADGALEGGDLLADRRLGVAEPQRGRAEGRCRRPPAGRPAGGCPSPAGRSYHQVG